MITGIVVALPEELSTLTAKKIAKGQVVFISETIIVAYSGAGASNASAAAQLLIAKGATRLMSWGCAGALSQNINSGDLVLANSLLDSYGDLSISQSISSVWHSNTHQQLSKTITVHCGLLVESLDIVSTSTAKQALHQETGALAVDMESVAVAKIALQHAKPYLVIRSIVDPVYLDLPRAISQSLNAQGEVVMRQLLWHIVRNPNEIPALIKLGRHFNAAKNTLKVIAKQLDSLTDQPFVTVSNIRPV